MRRFPAKDRPGKDAWLGPLSLCLGLLSWPIPAGGVVLALGAVACGAVSMGTRTEYRLDWTAVTGTTLAVLQLLLSLMLFAMTAGGH
ncbi:hypothetical protein [Saccharothrix sp. NRRL B-16314]|uniref:hypothetical protein n=1 Tax=Saccharothrix sp. NRRL B-16314 TaxID=1463825 RepID=UPI0012DE1C1E|nr:hypothetical protein [Saccharothrix sp. NRRL B-16314]